MLQSALKWLGLHDSRLNHGRSSHHDAAGQHGHMHGVIDPSIALTERGLWAVKWSFIILAFTALFQLIVVLASDSIALFADTIHNIGDALTAVPLWIAFMLARRPPNKRFTYGYGRVEDFAGVVIVLIILISALVATYESVDRLFHPRTITLFGWVAAAGVIGFVGNEVVAILRIRVGREINSAALIADGYHARTDGLTSLAVVVGALGVSLGYPLADPIVGLIIAAVIFMIVWQSAKAVFLRMLDAIEPEILDEIHHAAEHVSGLEEVREIKARWLGHRLHADVSVRLNSTQTLSEAKAIAEAFEEELHRHIPPLAHVSVRFT